MYDPQALRLHLMQVLAALERIPRRFAGIHEAGDFLASDEGLDRLDAICMMLIAVGEALKQIDRKTGGQLLARYPEVDWAGVKGVRDVVAHGYFDVDADQVFAICQQDIPALLQTVRRMIAELAEPGPGGTPPAGGE
jgi:uncharacterized protein with HEPN domain